MNFQLWRIGTSFNHKLLLLEHWSELYSLENERICILKTNM